MKVEDIKRYILLKNLTTKKRTPYFVFNRMYVASLLFYNHKWSLVKIAKLLNYKDHLAVRNLLIKVHVDQHREDFYEATREIQEQCYILVPPYQIKNHAQQNFDITISVKRERYINYLKSRDPEELYDMIWTLTCRYVSTRKKHK